jgi:exosome complex RNA-binding protein Rrp42 (RNase PH superfamily)
MCLIEAEITAPRKSTKPGAGSISFSMDFLPMAHPSAIDSNTFDTLTEQCIVMLESLFRDAYCIDFDTLCIEANKFAYKILEKSTVFLNIFQVCF